MQLFFCVNLGVQAQAMRSAISRPSMGRIGKGKKKQIRSVCGLSESDFAAGLAVDPAPDGVQTPHLKRHGARTNDEVVEQKEQISRQGENAR